MAIGDEVREAVASLFSEPWAITGATTVPKQDDIALKNGGRKFNATYLYADMADSSRLVKVAPVETVAKITRAFLNASVRVIRNQQGHIRSFDGDRVMGVFIGDGKENRAVKAALQINHAVSEIIRPASVEKYKSIRDSGWQLRHGCGIATADTLIVRAGVRDNDDLISVGVAPNLAAKLSERRDYPRSTFVGAGTYKALSGSSLYANGGDTNMFTGPLSIAIGGTSYTYYASAYRSAI